MAVKQVSKKRFRKYISRQSGMVWHTCHQTFNVFFRVPYTKRFSCLACGDDFGCLMFLAAAKQVFFFFFFLESLL